MENIPTGGSFPCDIRWQAVGGAAIPGGLNEGTVTVLAFEIEIDGTPWVCAGVEDWSILAFHVTASRREPNSKVRDGYVEASVHGMALPVEGEMRHHFRWPNAALKVGSSVSARIVEVEVAEPPKKRYQSDGTVQENPFTEPELREMRYQDYLDLKAEFAGVDDDERS